MELTETDLPLHLLKPTQTYNLAEFFSRSVVLLWLMTQGDKESNAGVPSVSMNHSIVLSTALNLPLQPYHHTLLQPFSNLKAGDSVGRATCCYSQSRTKNTCEY